ncbi:MAG: WD40 repeat domain-containing protein [Pseudomonadota bacterium]
MSHRKSYETRPLAGSWRVALVLALMASGLLGIAMADGRSDWTGAELQHEIEVEGESVEQLALSPDGRRMAIATSGSLEVREVPFGEPRHRLEGHRSPEVDRPLPITGLAFSPDGEMLASTSWNPGVAADASLKLWDPATGRLIQALAGGQGCREVAFSEDGGSVWAACGSDVQRYLLETGRVVERAEDLPAELLHGHDAEAASDALPMPRQGPAQALALSADGTQLAWAGNPPTFPRALVRLWRADKRASEVEALSDYQRLELPKVSATQDPVAQAREHYGLRELNPVTSETVSQRMLDSGSIEVNLRLDNLRDDAVHALRYRLHFMLGSDGRWILDQAGRQQQCRRGPTGPDKWTLQLCH